MPDVASICGFLTRQKVIKMFRPPSVVQPLQSLVLPFVRHTTLLVLTVLFSIGSTRYRSRYSLGIAK